MKERDKNIIQGIKKGKESAFSALFQEYYKPLCIFALQYMGELESAREIVQDQFVHLYEIREKLLITDSLRSFMYQSVRNRCLNALRHQQVNRKHMEQWADAQHSTGNLMDQIEALELEHTVHQIIMQLPARCRQVFLLSRTKGASNEEIAGKLNISKRTVETQISKALRTIREELGYVQSSSRVSLQQGDDEKTGSI